MLIIEDTLFTNLFAICLMQLTLHYNHHPLEVGGKWNLILKIVCVYFLLIMTAVIHPLMEKNMYLDV